MREQYKVPAIYDLIWQLRPAGVLNLNLDGLVTRAYTARYPTRSPQQFKSTEVASYMHLLKNTQPYIYNMHGTDNDVSSWVLTYDELGRLLANPSYLAFITSVLTTSTVVFLGITANDVAVGGHLERLQKLGMDFGSHYWVTTKSDIETDDWAEKSSIRVIRYFDKDRSHRELNEMFQDLLRYVPPDESEQAPIVFLPRVLPKNTLPSVANILGMPAEEARFVLNGYAVSLLRSDDQSHFDEYERFLKKYDQAIYHAWYVNIDAGVDTLLGYTLDEAVGRGAFGRVFRSRDVDGEDIAIKVLLPEVRGEKGFLQSFRRGVRSMRILSDNRVAGMVQYKEASEIPAFVVMEWVPGPNLREAVQSNLLPEWHLILRAGVELADIIRAAHGLPERVLHRDIRPPNIMLSDAWSSEDWTVKVLDFDLSWHRGAYEVSVVAVPGANGYLAPEQVERRSGVSTRHAAVDAFGLGMTLYFMVSRRDPVPEQHRHSDWVTVVESASTRLHCREWHSTSARYARLVLSSTRDRQSERLDVSQILSELQRLREAVLTPGTVTAPDMVAEELAIRTHALLGYRWDENRLAAVIQRDTGLRLSLGVSEIPSEVELVIERLGLGFDVRSTIERTLARTVESAVSVLVGGGWRIKEQATGRSDLRIRAVNSVSNCQSDIGRAAITIDKAIDQLRPT